MLEQMLISVVAIFIATILMSTWFRKKLRKMIESFIKLLKRVANVL